VVPWSQRYGRIATWAVPFITACQLSFHPVRLRCLSDGDLCSVYVCLSDVKVTASIWIHHKKIFRILLNFRIKLYVQCKFGEQFSGEKFGGIFFLSIRECVNMISTANARKLQNVI
jgi:hypothetical protein